MDGRPAMAFGIDLHLTTTAEGGRTTPLLNLAEQTWVYRPNWGLPSMIPPDQSGAPVLAFSRDHVGPGESAHAVIVNVFPATLDQWHREVQPGAVLRMYEGARVCGHGTVLWREQITLPLNEVDKQRFLRWLQDPARSPDRA